MSILNVLVAAVLAGGVAIAAKSAPVTVLDTTDQINGSFTLGDFGGSGNQVEPLGQTFTLDSATSSIVASGSLRDVNLFSNPTFEVTAAIYGGDNFGAPVLGTSTVTLPDDFQGVQSFDFSSLGTLDAGTYALGFFSPGSRGALDVSSLDPAASTPIDSNGPFDFSSTFNPDSNSFAVSITGDVGMTGGPAVVPLPATLPLLAAGLAACALVARRRHS
jgi:hypothetical protein